MLESIHDQLWKVSKGTNELRMILTEEIEGLKEKLSSGILLTSSNDEKLVREYSQTVGQIKALRIVKDLITDKSEVVNE